MSLRIMDTNCNNIDFYVLQGCWMMTFPKGMEKYKNNMTN